MCGIAAVMGCADVQIINTITQALFHRGPDDVGYYKSCDVQLGMRRLSIIDLETGQQPVFNEKRDKCVIFNGEIYNYKELKELLCQKGHIFTTQTDTEIIIHLYEEYGDQCVTHLRGMFTFVISDGEKLFIARDRLGIKPIYYTFVEGKKVFLLASEIKGLLACKDVSITLNMQALADSFLLGHPTKPHTFFTGIMALQPGSTLIVEHKHGAIELEEKVYYQPSFTINNSISFKNAEKKLLDLLISACDIHLRADVEIGLALSGGLDSSLLAMIINKYFNKRLRTFTIADSSEHPDILLSQNITTNINSLHSVSIIDFDEYFNSIPEFIATEERFTNLSGLPFYLLCKDIGTQVKVFLNGEGADELFGGYKVYLDQASFIPKAEEKLAILRNLKLCPSFFTLNSLRDISTVSSFDEYIKRIFEFYFKDQLMYQHLESTDKYAMSASLECRVPYLDHEIVNFVNTLPPHFKANKNLRIYKYILKKVAIETFGEALADIVLRQKIGFPSTGLKHLKRLTSICEDMLPNDYLNIHPLKSIFSSKTRLLIFDLFIEIFMKWRGVVPNNFDLKEFIRERS
jgi:asparagine synthase (glutamine-hydrolysing)